MACSLLRVLCCFAIVLLRVLWRVVYFAMWHLPSHSGAFVIHRDLQLIEDIHGHEPATDEPATDEPATSLSQVRGLGYHQRGICHGATYPPRSSVGATATMWQMPQSGSIWPSGSIWLPHLPHLHSGSVWPSRRLVCLPWRKTEHSWLICHSATTSLPRRAASGKNREKKIVTAFYP